MNNQSSHQSQQEQSVDLQCRSGTTTPCHSTIDQRSAVQSIRKQEFKNDDDGKVSVAKSMISQQNKASVAKSVQQDIKSGCQSTSKQDFIQQEQT